MLVEGQFPVAAAPETLLAHLFDARLMASCLPGCESLEAIDDDRYRAVVVVGMAGIKARFDLEVEITAREALDVWALTRGAEGGQASTLRAESQVSLRPAPDGTLVVYRSEVSLTGRLGRFALGMMKKKAQSMGDEFAENLRLKMEQLGADARTAAAEPTAWAPDRAELPAPRPAAAGSAPEQQLPAAARRSWWRRLLAWLRGERTAQADTSSRGSPP